MLTVGTQREQIAASLDYLGQTFLLNRYDGESLSQYRTRIIDAVARNSNSTKLGLIFGLTHQLGATVKQVGVLEAVGLGYPGISIDSTSIRFYEDIDLELLEQEFVISDDFPSPDKEKLFYLEDLFNWVDTTSSYWDWDVPPQVNERALRARHIVPLESYQFLDRVSNARPGVIRTGKYLIGSSVQSASDYIQTLVASQDLVTEKGEYYVDEDAGIIYTYDDGGTDSFVVSFTSWSKKVNLLWAPVTVYDLNSPKVKDRFSQKLKSHDNVTYENFAFSWKLAQVIVEAYKADGTFWFAQDTNDTPVDILERYITSDILTEGTRYFFESSSELRGFIE